MKRFSGNQISIPHEAMLKLRQAGKLNLGMVNDVAMKIADNSDLAPGTIVDVECNDGKIHKAEICKLPMYDPKGEIVRGINKNIPKKPEPWVGIKTN